MIKSQALGGRSNRVLIFRGLFLGLGSAGLGVVYRKGAGGDGGEVSGAVMTPVVVANQSIPVGTRVTEERVTVKDITSDAVLVGAYGETTDVVGQVARVPLVAGEQVIPTKVTATGAAIADVENPPLAYVVPDGKRAVSVEVSSVIGASGLIRPGDYVDVILTVKVDALEDTEESTASGSISDQLAVTILQNAQVLSIDQNVVHTVVVEGEEAPLISDEGSDANPEATTVTLAVSPAHGEVLTVAEACGANNGGRLALSLRPFGDSSVVGTRSVWAEDGPPPTCAALLGLPTP